MSPLPAADTRPVPDDDGAAAHLVGTRMPGVVLRSTGGDIVDVSAFASGRTVIYVYPLTSSADGAVPEGWDEIPGARGCTPEACSFRDHFAELRAAGVSELYGLSRQTTAYQREAVERLHLPFDLLADPEGRLGEILGLPSFDVDGLTLYRRLTLVIADGVIEHVFYPVFPPESHATEILDWVCANPL